MRYVDDYVLIVSRDLLVAHLLFEIGASHVNEMGVPAFFAWLSRKYPQIILYCIEAKASVLIVTN